MSDTPSHVSVSSPSLSKSLPFFATLASVKPGVNYGPIINVAGFPFSWTPSGYEPSSGVTPFGSYAELSALGSSARIGVVDGTVYAWSETLGRHVPQAQTFLPTLTGDTLSTSTLAISSGISQRISLPLGTHVRMTFLGYGPFSYKLGGESVTAVSTDSPANTGAVIIAPKLGSTHVAVYGIGAGTMVVEGGAI